MTLGGFLRFYQIGDKGLWLDEAFSVWMGWQPVREMFGWLVSIDQHPPLYYTLLHFWMIPGDDAATVRALSALLGTLTIPVIYLLGRRLADGDEKIGLLAALILAVSPFHVRFAQEARMYTLLALNAALALYALLCLLTTSRPVRASQAGYILFTTATLLSHNTAIFFAIAANVFALSLILIRSRLATRDSRPAIRDLLRNWLLAQAGVLVLWSPWLPAFVVQAASVYREFWIPAPTWLTVVGTVGAFLSDFVLWPWIVWGLFAGLALLGLIRLRRRPARVALLFVVFLTPFAGEWLVSLRRPIFYDRTLIWASIPLYLLLAAGVGQLRRLRYILVAVLTIMTINGLSLKEYYTHFEKEQWDDAAAFVAERVETDDLILFNATWVQIPFDFYFRFHNHPVAEHGVPVDLFDRGILEPKMTTSDLPRLRSLIRGRERVWLIYSHDWYTDPQGLIPQALEGELNVLGRWNFYGLQVRLYGSRQ